MKITIDIIRNIIEIKQNNLAFPLAQSISIVTVICLSLITTLMVLTLTTTYNHIKRLNEEEQKLLK